MLTQEEQFPSQILQKAFLKHQAIKEITKSKVEIYTVQDSLQPKEEVWI